MPEEENRMFRHPVRVEPLRSSLWGEAEWDAISVLPEEMRPVSGVEINALNVMAHHPTLSKAVLQWSLYLRFESELSDRQRELLILRTAWLNRADYELTRHARLARRYGFRENELEAIAAGSASETWSSDDEQLLRMAEELHATRYVSDETWSRCIELFGVQLTMDAVFVVGTYTMLAMAYGSMGVRPESDLQPFPVPFPIDDDTIRDSSLPRKGSPS